MNSPSLVQAAAGRLPAWACVSPRRAAHIARVAGLLTSWARVLAPADLDLWRAAAWLHDALRDADAHELRALLPAEFQDWPDALVHGPAAAARVASEADDAPGSLLDAVRYHTVGHARLDLLGRALYLADFLEPGRTFSPAWCASQRALMPERIDDVLRVVAAARIEHMVQSGAPLRAETTGFWNSIVSG